MQQFISGWVGNGLTVLGGIAAVGSPLLSGDISVSVAVGGGLAALVGSCISIYSGSKQGAELNTLRDMHKPRLIAEPDRQRLAAALSPFRGQEFELYCHNDDDARRLCSVLQRCLLDAGWVQAAPRGSVMLGDGRTNLVDVPDTGILIGGPTTGFGQSLTGTETLLESLHRIGLEARHLAHEEFDAYPNRLHLFVGLKSRGIV